MSGNDDGDKWEAIAAMVVLGLLILTAGTCIVVGMLTGAISS